MVTQRRDILWFWVVSYASAARLSLRSGSSHELSACVPKAYGTVFRTTPEGECKFLQSDKFYLQLQPTEVDRSQTGFLVLTDTRLFAFSCDFRSPCVAPEVDSVAWVESASLATATLSFAAVPLEDSHSGACATVRGCSDSSCKSGYKSWRVCAFEKTDCHKALVNKWQVLAEWDSLILNAYLKITNLQARLAPMIRESVDQLTDGSMDGHKSSWAPPSFSPFAFGTESTPESQELLWKMVASFEAGIIPHFPGENSRSGAAFFFSSDRAYIAKRIRDFEREALYAAIKDAEYQKRIKVKGSVLNPIYLSFERGASVWIIMRTETLPEGVKDRFPPELTQSFFMDVKPSPLKSDRIKTAAVFSEMHAKLGISPSDLPGWDKIANAIRSDSAYLEKYELVDYSMLMHGSFFYEPDGSAEESAVWQKDLADKASARNGCSFGCQDPSPRNLVDVTAYMLPYGTLRGAPVGDSEYICCCQDVQPGEAASIKHPCLLVKTNVNSNVVSNYTDDCAAVTQSDKWIDYHKAKDLPVQAGRCLLAMGAMTPDVSVGTFDVVGPEAAFGLSVANKGPKACLFTCLSIFDYLLPLNAWNRIENALLLPVYGDFKWNKYRPKINSLADCLSHSPLPIVNQNASLFDIDVFNKKVQGNDCERTLQSYEHDFPRMDMQVMQGRRMLPEQIDSDKLPDTNTCDPSKAVFPRQCVIEPGPKGDEWVQQLRDSKCLGNVFVIKMGEDKFVAVKALGTEDLVNGYFVHTIVGNDFEDEDWMLFRHTSIHAVSDEGGMTVKIENKDWGDAIPIDIAVYDGTGGHVFDHTNFLTLTAQRGESSVHLFHQKAKKVEVVPNAILFFWPKRTETRYEPVEEHIGTLKEADLMLCTPPQA